MSPLTSRRLIIWTAAVLLVCSAPSAIARPQNRPPVYTQPSVPPPPYAKGPDDEPMMGDMPAADDAMSTSLVINSRDEGTTEPTADVFDADSETQKAREIPAENENFEGKYVDSPIPNKNLRLKAIMDQMLTFMGRTTRTPSPVPTVKTQSNVSTLIPSVHDVDMQAFYDVKTNPTAYTSDGSTEKTQSYYPICEIPKHTNEEVWNSKESMNLMFNISMPRAMNYALVNVSSVKLRLYKQYVSCYSQTSNETDDTPQTSCQPTFLEDGVKRPANSSSMPSSAEIQSASPDDRQIRVSIYVRSVKKKKVKRRLLDSRMISYYGEKWTEWNIYRAVKSWRSPVRSFALSIEIEDEYGNFLPVNRFFKSMNCTGDAHMTTPKPIPGILMEAMHFGLSANGNDTSNMSASQALSLNMYRYPIVDVTTVEWLELEDAKNMFMQWQADAMQQTAVDAAQAYRENSSSGEQHRHHNHRIRHGGGGNRHKINLTDVQSTVAKLARDSQLQQQKQQQQQAVASHASGASSDSVDSENTDVDNLD